ncbi:hypothetical protein SynROS8604_00415 [Synechococcus sp. ROS8604]|nr:hypothetical protein SynROS8604_00415 [Synechococcus sp. ROS8604]
MVLGSQPVFFYEAFGILLISSGMKIPELPVAKSEMQNNYSGSINIVQDEQSNWPELTPIFADTANLQMRPGELRLTIPNMISFRVTNGDRISWCRLRSNVTNQTIRTYMLGSALGAALIQRGILVLHGNALEKHNRAIVCMGYSGAGKSTLAYALMQQGWNLLADDLVAVTPTGLILPGVPRIKLWRDAVCAFNLNPSQLKTVMTGVDKFLVQKKIYDT